MPTIYFDPSPLSSFVISYFLFLSPCCLQSGPSPGLSCATGRALRSCGATRYRQLSVAVPRTLKPSNEKLLRRLYAAGASYQKGPSKGNFSQILCIFAEFNLPQTHYMNKQRKQNKLIKRKKTLFRKTINLRETWNKVVKNFSPRIILSKNRFYQLLNVCQWIRNVYKNCNPQKWPEVFSIFRYFELSFSFFTQLPVHAFLSELLESHVHSKILDRTKTAKCRMGESCVIGANKNGQWKKSCASCAFVAMKASRGVEKERKEERESLKTNPLAWIQVL